MTDSLENLKKMHTECINKQNEKYADQAPSLPVSIPMNRLKPTTVQRFKKASLDQEKKCSVKEINAPTLRSYLGTESTKNTYRRIEHQLPQNNFVINPVRASVEKSKEKQNINEKKLDENNVGENSNASQFEEIYRVSKDDFDLLALIKSKGLDRSYFSELQPEGPAVNETVVEDINNNLTTQTNLETQTVNLRTTNEQEFVLDPKISDQLISYSEQNKAMFAKMIDLYQNREKEECNKVSGKVAQIINEIIGNAKQLGMDKKIPLTLNLNVGIQTPLDCKEPNKKYTTKRVYEEIIELTEDVSPEVHQTSDSIGDDCNQSVAKSVKMHQVPISPVAGSLPSLPTETQDQKPMDKKQHSSNCHTEYYPNTRMMSALEVQELFRTANSRYGVENHQQLLEDRRAAVAAYNQRAAAAAAYNAASPSADCNPQQQYQQRMDYHGNKRQRFMQNAYPASTSAPQAFAPRQLHGFYNQSVRDTSGFAATAATPPAAFAPRHAPSYNRHSFNQRPNTEPIVSETSRHRQCNKCVSHYSTLRQSQQAGPAQNGCNELLLKQQNSRQLQEEWLHQPPFLQNYPNTAWGHFHESNV